MFGSQRKVYLERCDKFLDTYWEGFNLCESVFYQKLISAPSVNDGNTAAASLNGGGIKLSHCAVEGLGRPAFGEVVSAGGSQFKPTGQGSSFGPSWATHWFRVELHVPSEWPLDRTHFLWNSNSEACVFNEAGVPLQGLTGGTGVDRRHVFRLTGPGGAINSAEIGGSSSSLSRVPIVFYVEMACNGMFGCGKAAMLDPPQPDRQFTLSQCALGLFNSTAFQMYYDFETLYHMARDLADTNDVVADRALTLCNDVINATWIDSATVHNESTYERGHAMIQQFLNSVDTCWLWPYAETRRKVYRSWSSQLRLLAEYPEAEFAASSAVQYEWLLEDHPALFAQIQEAVRDGRWHVTGGTWVEMDCNMPSGESLVRQFLYGQRFFQQHFGRLCTEFWLPDTFGYAWQLPQIVRGAGMEFFLTQKLSWSLINRFPHNSFWWQGLDGSRVLTHFPPADSYEAQCTVSDMVKSVRRNQNKKFSNSAMVLYGVGDGGGGPQPRMLERMRRMRDTDGLPRVRHGSPHQFFQQLLAEAGNRLPTWSGELYLELHQGTYTTHANVKRRNRLCERLLRDAELLSTLVAHTTAAGSDADGLEQAAQLTYLWKQVNLNQFHDAIPGSSIPEVYVDMHRIYDEVETKLTAIIEANIAKLIANASTDSSLLVADSDLVRASEAAASPAKKRSRRQPQQQSTPVAQPVLFNSLGWDRTCVVPRADDDNNSLALVRVPAFGFGPADSVGGAGEPSDVVSVRRSAVAVGVAADGGVGSERFVLENRFLRATFDPVGQLTELVHKNADTGHERSVLAGLGNRFVIFEDIPFYWDAWDVISYHLEKQDPPNLAPPTAGCQIGPQQGPLRGELTIVRQLTRDGSCSLRQTVRLDSESPVLVFDTTVDWHESHRFLKMELPVAVHTSQASYEIQYGHLQRPTHCNTSWEQAAFEKCAHRWVHVAEHNFGCALLNDSKYGHAVTQQPDGSALFRMSLLRAPKRPDDGADMGQHQFTYAIYCHDGAKGGVGPGESGVIRRAMELNSPAIPCPEVALSGGSFLRFLPSSYPGVQLDCVKRGEDRPQRDLVMRFYECRGGRGLVQLQVPFLARGQGYHAVVTDLLERPLTSSVVFHPAESIVEFDILPFQIITIKLEGK